MHPKPAMNLEEQSDVVLTLGQALHVNGQSTDDTLAAAERLSNSLGLRATIIPSWGELQLEAAEGTTRLVSLVAASPTGVHMERVASSMKAVDEVTAGHLPPTAALQTIGAISQAPPAPTWLFALAAAAGAASLSVLYGIQHIVAVMLIVLSAAAGAVLRRILAHYSTNAFLQPLCAALLAGAIGALAVRFQLSSALRLVAVCPCMILVPGPHLLNGTIDVARARVALGASRIAYAGVIILMICTGLLTGLSFGSVSLPVSVPSYPVPLGFDVIAAGVAVAAYGTFFAMPWRMLPIPVAIGMLAHASRWGMISLAGASVETGAFVACLVVGILITPIADRLRLPFAAFAFASVVSLIPGVYLFRMAGGFVDLVTLGDRASVDVVLNTIADGTTAALIILAMAFGLILPKMCIERFCPSLANPIRRGSWGRR